MRLPQQQVYKFGYLAVLFFPPGLLIGLFGRTLRDRAVVSVAYLFTVAVTMEGALMLASGRAFDWSNAVVTGAAAAVVLTLVGGTLSEPDLRRSQEYAGRVGKHPRD